MRTILITGASRGIGLLLSRLYAGQPETRVYATCRAPERAGDLRSLAEESRGAVHILQLDVTSDASIATCAAQVRDEVTSLDVLINNAGVLPGGVAAREPSSSAFGSLSAEAVLGVFRTNTVAPVMVSQAFAPLLRTGSRPRIINVSSDAGSFSRTATGCSYSYPASKAALNFMTRCMAADLKDAGIIVVAVHPGFVRTEMGGPGAHNEPEETVPSLAAVIDRLSIEDTAGFYNWDGQVIPW